MEPIHWVVTANGGEHRYRYLVGESGARFIKENADGSMPDGTRKFESKADADAAASEIRHMRVPCEACMVKP